MLSNCPPEVLNHLTIHGQYIKNRFPHVLGNIQYYILIIFTNLMGKIWYLFFFERVT